MIVAGALVLAGCGDNLEARDDHDGGWVTGCGGATGNGGEGGSGGGGVLPANAFTVIALPDTQYYSLSYPDIFNAQVDWILDQRTERRIPFVLHEGDVVNDDFPIQWERASRALHKLDGIVPYVLAQGNHDYFTMGGILDRASMVNQYFPVVALAAAPGFLGSFEPDRVENTARLLMMGDTPWLVISLEFGPRAAALQWADGILKAHSSTPAMVVTHAYLYWDGTRYDHVAHPFDQEFSPYHYAASPPPGSVSDGEEMWKKVIEANENVQFVISGHVFKYPPGDAAASLTSTHPSGRKVHQIVANYQETALGGAGYLRLMQFCPGEGEVRVSTYSPYLDSWKRDPANQFTLPLP